MEEKKLGRRERKKIASRKAILAAAKQEFVRQGYKETSIADIMERADLGVGTFYNYFSSKEEILMSLLMGIMGEVTAHLAAMKEAGRSALDRLTVGCQDTARLLDENRFVLALFLSVGERGGAPHGKTVKGAQPAPLIAETLHGLFQSAAFSHLGLPFRENFEGKLKLLLDGVRQG